MSLAVILGRFFGAMLAECAPVITEIIAHAIRQAFSDTVEDGARRDDLRERLLERLHANGPGASGRAGAAPEADPKGQGLDRG
jgi:hypothetical protein